MKKPLTAAQCEALPVGTTVWITRNTVYEAKRSSDGFTLAESAYIGTTIPIESNRGHWSVHWKVYTDWNSAVRSLLVESLRRIANEMERETSNPDDMEYAWSTYRTHAGLLDEDINTDTRPYDVARGWIDASVLMPRPDEDGKPVDVLVVIERYNSHGTRVDRRVAQWHEASTIQLPEDADLDGEIVDPRIPRGEFTEDAYRTYEGWFIWNDFYGEYIGLDEEQSSLVTYWTPLLSLPSRAVWHEPDANPTTD